MLEIPVVCAVIRRASEYLAVQRSASMREALLWEFPGGKVEAGETLISCLHREIKEELHATVSVRGIMRPSIQVQKERTIVLHPLLCTLTSPDFQLQEHAAYRWLSVKEFSTLTWCPADIDILELLIDKHLEATGWWI